MLKLVLGIYQTTIMMAGVMVIQVTAMNIAAAPKAEVLRLLQWNIPNITKLPSTKSYSIQVNITFGSVQRGKLALFIYRMGHNYQVLARRNNFVPGGP